MPRGINLRTVTEPMSGAPAPAKHWVPGKSGLRVLKLALERYRLFDRSIMAAAYEDLNPQGVGGTHVADVLTRLAEHGYLQRFPRRAQPGTGSLPLVYAPTVEAARLFDGQVSWTPQQLKTISNACRPRASYDHELGLSLLRLLWEVGSRPFTNPENDDYRFQTMAYLGDHSHGFSVVQRRGRAVVAPDTSVLVYHHDPDESRRHYRRVHFELERTRRSAARTVRRFQRYAHLLADEDGAIAECFDRWYSIVPEHATAVFVGADPAHQELLLREARYALGLEASADGRRPAQPRVKRVPDFLFGHIETWFDRVPVVRRNGKGSVVERILAPTSRFFTEQLYVDLNGTPRRVLDLRRSSDAR